MTIHKTGRPRPQDADRYVGARLRECRIILGMTQHQLAALVGIHYQQQGKYEKGINRIAVGRLYQIARLLGVDIGYFFEGLQSGRRVVAAGQRRMLLELSRNFVNIRNPEHREALTNLARALAEPQNGKELAA
jgi:transcriptional regulator with XRE-family HTH domain